MNDEKYNYNSDLFQAPKITMLTCECGNNLAVDDYGTIVYYPDGGKIFKIELIKGSIFCSECGKEIKL